MTPTLPEVTTYDELRSAISQARSESRLRTEKAVEEERVLEAWQPKYGPNPPVIAGLKVKNWC